MVLLFVMPLVMELSVCIYVYGCELFISSIMFHISTTSWEFMYSAPNLAKVKEEFTLSLLASWIGHQSCCVALFFNGSLMRGNCNFAQMQAFVLNM